MEVEAATGDEEGVYGDLVGVYDELAHLSGQSAEECGEGLDPGLAAHYREWLELEVPLPKPLSWLLT